jgi:FMN-dependent NADH-azoreductase
VAASFVSAYQTAHGDETITVRDLDKEPLPHIDGEALTAGYMPEEARPESMQKKHQLRLDLIKEITEAKAIVVSSPMWNWNIPSVLKAYIDHLVMPGTLDPYGFKLLAGKAVTIIVASGSAYGDGSQHPEFDHEVPYLKFIFTSLGATDITVIRTEFTLAGVVPGMEGETV